MKMKIVNFFRINKKEENNITTSNLNNIIAEDDMRTKPNINKKLVIKKILFCLKSIEISV